MTYMIASKSMCMFNSWLTVILLFGSYLDSRSDALCLELLMKPPFSFVLSQGMLMVSWACDSLGASLSASSLKSCTETHPLSPMLGLTFQLYPREILLKLLLLMELMLMWRQGACKASDLTFCQFPNLSLFLTFFSIFICHIDYFFQEFMNRFASILWC